MIALFCSFSEFPLTKFIQIMKKVFLLVCLIYAFQGFSQSPSVQRIDPTNWFVGMKNPKLQLLVYGKNINDCEVKINYPGISLDKVNKVENPNYLFLDLTIAPETQAGQFMVEIGRAHV